MARKETKHPNLKEVKYLMPDGTYLVSLSTYSKGDFHCEKTLASILNKKDASLTKGSQAKRWEEKYGENDYFA